MKITEHEAAHCNEAKISMHEDKQQELKYTQKIGNSSACWDYEHFFPKCICPIIPAKLNF